MQMPKILQRQKRDPQVLRWLSVTQWAGWPGMAVWRGQMMLGVVYSQPGAALEVGARVLAQCQTPSCHFSIIPLLPPSQESEISSSFSHNLDLISHWNLNFDSKCWQGCGERGTPMHCRWDCKSVQPLMNTEIPHKINTGATIWPSHPSSECQPKNLENTFL